MLHFIPNIANTNSGNFFLIAGLCVVESEEICFSIAERILEMTTRLQVPYIFKASYRKANRSRSDSFTGIGDNEALQILKKVKDKFQVPVLTDIHESDDAAVAAQYAD